MSGLEVEVRGSGMQGDQKKKDESQGWKDRKFELPRSTVEEEGRGSFGEQMDETTKME